MIRAVFFDLDGVIRLWSSANDTQPEQATGLPAGAIRAAAFAPDILEPAITGHISDETWRAQVAARLRMRFPHVDTEEAVRLWSTSPGEVDQQVINVVRACRQKAVILLITNATSRLPRDLAQLDLTQEFDAVINSATVHAIKPHAGIFAAALQASGVPVAETLFVDDTSANVAAAVQLGMQGHVYHGLHQLSTELKGHGLLENHW